MFSLLSFVIVFLFSGVLADEGYFVKDQEYDGTGYGLYPKQTYKSTSVIAPRINRLAKSSECDDALYTMLTPRGPIVSSEYAPSATILDSKGHLIWTLRGHEQVYNLMVQEYMGQQYLTFWAGNDAVGGHGAGYYYMLDTSYNEVFKIDAVNGLQADLHDFRITPSGTAMFTVYEIIEDNLTSIGGPEKGPVWDCLIQEIDIKTQELIFQWRASKHYDLADTYRGLGGDGVLGRAFDWFHINSVDKDLQGNYIISSRYLHSITYIHGDTGDIIWVFGGKKNMFKDLSGGKATNIAYQHDARWSDDYTTLTVFNNGVDDAHPHITETRGMRIKIDQKLMTAELVAEYLNPGAIRAISQGSFQTLNNGNAFMGYGNSAAYTEYNHNGTVLCDTHFGPQSRFGAGEVQSYRVYKYEWHGWPTDNPAAVILETSSEDNDNSQWTLFFSWNGATEVVLWKIEGANDVENEDKEWSSIGEAQRVGFESEYIIPSSAPRFLRVRGLNSKGEVLGTSNPLDVAVEKVWSQPPLRINEGDTWALRILIGFCGVIGLIVGSREALILWRTHRRRLHFQRLPMIEV